MKPLRAAPLALGIAALVAAGCGGSQRQDADEESGVWQVSVDAEFPEQQRLSRREELRITVRNEEAERAIPNAAVTVKGFSMRSEQQGLADPNRPVWIVDREPEGGDTAYTDTWALGRIPAGGEEEFVWRVTPVEPGAYEVSYRVSAGLDGRAKARTDGRIPEGSFSVQVDDAPTDARVDPETGGVVGR